MTHILAALDFLESLDTQWTAFCRQAADLAETFAEVSRKTELEEAVRRLIGLCQEYPYLALLLRQPGSKRPPAPIRAPEFNPQEVVRLEENLSEGVKVQFSLEEAERFDPREVAQLYCDLLKRLVRDGI